MVLSMLSIAYSLIIIRQRLVGRCVPCVLMQGAIQPV
jgi:hypothetical protein